MSVEVPIEVIIKPAVPKAFINAFVDAPAEDVLTPTSIFKVDVISALGSKPTLPRLLSNLAGYVLDKIQSGNFSEKRSTIDRSKWRGSGRSRRCRCSPDEKCTCGKRVSIFGSKALVVAPENLR